MTHHDTLVLVVIITDFTTVGHSIQELQSLDGFHKIFQGLGFVAVVFWTYLLSNGLEEYSVLCTVDSQSFEVDRSPSEIFPEQSPPLISETFKTDPDPAAVSVHQ